MRVKFQDWGSGFDRFAERIRDMIQEMRHARSFCSHARPSWSPRINLYETGSHIVVCIDLAGLAPDAIELRLTGGILQVEGIRQRPILPDELEGTIAREDISVHSMEIDSGQFCRAVKLPAEVASDHAFATYRRGLLWIVAPKLEPSA